jgi:hypothetical protein
LLPEGVLKFAHEINNNGVFYTDSNGLAMQKREFGKRSFPAYDMSQPQKNYYPVTTAIAIRDDKLQMTVMNSHTQGGGSLKNGQIELMQNRRMTS